MVSCGVDCGVIKNGFLHFLTFPLPQYGVFNISDISVIFGVFYGPVYGPLSDRFMDPFMDPFLTTFW